jgi:hypothetical protein
MIRKVAVLILALGTVLVPGGSEAQVGPPGGGRQRQQLERRLEMGFARIVQNRLGLTPEKLGEVQSVMQSFRADRQEINQAQASLRYRLRDPGLEQISDEDARDLLAEMIRVQEAELDLYRREQQELLTVLTPNQVLRFYGLREEWGRRIQELRQPGGPRGPGGGAGPVGGPPGSGGTF